MGAVAGRALTIAIDGPVAVGKSAVGSLVAERLGYRFYDTGAMYRALTWLALKRGLDVDDDEALSRLAAEADIQLSPGPLAMVFIDGCDVTDQVRQAAVEASVSQVSSIAGVREALVAQQQRLAQGGGVVMAGRDIGTVVLPQADLKIYLTASPEERARRRHRELGERGEAADYEDVLADLLRRDMLDSQRSISPLRPAADAVIIDTDGRSLEEVVGAALGALGKG